MKVALFADGIAPMVLGGMQKHSYYLAQHLAAAGVSVELHTMVYDLKTSDQVPKDLESIENLEIYLYEFPRSLRFPGHYVFNSYRLSKLFFNAIKHRLNEFDLVYTKGFMGLELLRNKMKLPHDVKVGVKLHGMNMFLPTHGLKQRLEQVLLRIPARYVMNRSDLVFSYGGKVTQTITDQGVPRGKILEIPTGIEREWVRETIKPTGRVRRVVFIGRNDPVKGYRELFSAIKEYQPFGELFFDIVGPFDGGDKFQHASVKFHGLIKEPNSIRKLLDEADALILPSFSEGMPNVILEAMARGLMIIATDVGAIKYLVGENGVFIQQTSTDSIIKSLQQFEDLSNIVLNQLKTASLERINSFFVWEKVSKMLVDSITEIARNDNN
jgi:glycosyltransferase involved in cell wall biosynthesis